MKVYFRGLERDHDEGVFIGEVPPDKLMDTFNNVKEALVYKRSPWRPMELSHHIVFDTERGEAFFEIVCD